MGATLIGGFDNNEIQFAIPIVVSKSEAIPRPSIRVLLMNTRSASYVGKSAIAVVEIYKRRWAGSMQTCVRQFVLRHDKIEKTVAINVTPDRVAPRPRLHGDYTRRSRDVAELLRDGY